MSAAGCGACPTRQVCAWAESLSLTRRGESSLLLLLHADGADDFGAPAPAEVRVVHARAIGELVRASAGGAQEDAHLRVR